MSRPRWGYPAAAVGGAGLVVALAAEAVTTGFDVNDLIYLSLGPLPYLALGTYTWSRRSHHPVATRLLLIGALFGAQVGVEFLARSLFEVYGVFGWYWLLLLVNGGLQVAVVVVGIQLIAFLPDGRPRGPAERALHRLAWLLLGAVALSTPSRPLVGVDEGLFEPAVVPSPVHVSWLEPLQIVESLLLPAVVGLLLWALGAVALRYRRGGRDARLQILWVAAPLPLIVLGYVIQPLLQGAGLIPADASSAASWVFFLPSVLVPVGVTISILQHRLLDIDVALRRSLVYAAASVTILGGYVGAAALLGITAAERMPVGAAILLTIAAMLVFGPVRQRLDRLAERRIFAGRLSRYELLTQVGATLEHALDVTELAPQIAAMLRDGLDVRWARVTLRLADGRPEQEAYAGDLAGPDDPALAVPLVHAG